MLQGGRHNLLAVLQKRGFDHRIGGQQDAHKEPQTVVKTTRFDHTCVSKRGCKSAI